MPSMMYDPRAIAPPGFNDDFIRLMRGSKPSPLTIDANARRVTSPYGYSPTPGIVSRGGRANYVASATDMPDGTMRPLPVRGPSAPLTYSEIKARDAAMDASRQRMRETHNATPDLAAVAAGALPAVARRKDLTPEQMGAFTERRNARKAEMAKRRQRQFARAQMRSGYLFNEDGSADVLGSMAAQLMGRGAVMPAVMAASQRDASLLEQGRLGLESDRLANETRLKRREMDLLDEQFDATLGLDTRRLTAEEKQAAEEAAIRRLEAETNRDLGLAESANQRALAGETIASSQYGRSQEAHERDLEKTNATAYQQRKAAEADELMSTVGAHQALRDQVQGDPDLLYDAFANIASTLEGRSPEEQDQILGSIGGFGVEELDALAKYEPSLAHKDYREGGIPWYLAEGFGLLPGSLGDDYSTIANWFSESKEDAELRAKRQALARSIAERKRRGVAGPAVAGALPATLPPLPSVPRGASGGWPAPLGASGQW